MTERLGHPADVRVRRSAAVGLIGLGAFAAGACAPCDGVIGCTASPRLGLSGEFVSRSAEAPPLPGVRVEVVSRSPDVLVDSVATATTNAAGWWSVSMRARAVATATVDLIVTPPAPDAPYRVRGLQYSTTPTRGVGAETGRWVPRPFISYIGVLLDKASGKPIAGARVTPVRRGGVDVVPTASTDTAPTTNAYGTFLYDVQPSTLAPLYVDFLVDRPGLPRATITTTVMPGYEWTPPHSLATTTFMIDSAGRVTGAGVGSPAAATAR